MKHQEKAPIEDRGKETAGAALEGNNSIAFKRVHMHYNKLWQPYTLDDIEHCILLACKHFDGKEATNTAIKAKARVKLPASEIGLILSRLRAVKLIAYHHIETGRMAAGSGRYFLRALSDYFGSVLEGEAERLP